MDPDLFFPESSGPRHRPGVTRRQEQAKAQAEVKATCARCQVSVECLTFALETRQDYGIWGGLDPEERFRAAMRRRQSKQIPA